METYMADTLIYIDTETESNDVIVWFTVPKEWAENWCKKNKWESLEKFDTEYVWDDSYEMYTDAKEDNVIINAKIEKEINMELTNVMELIEMLKELPPNAKVFVCGTTGYLHIIEDEDCKTAIVFDDSDEI